MAVCAAVTGGMAVCAAVTGGDKPCGTLGEGEGGRRCDTQTLRRASRNLCTHFAPPQERLKMRTCRVLNNYPTPYSLHAPRPFFVDGAHCDVQPAASLLTKSFTRNCFLDNKIGFAALLEASTAKYTFH